MAMKLFGKRKSTEERSRIKRPKATVQDKVEYYVQRLREGTDDIIIPITKFYRECQCESYGEEDGEMVIFELEKQGYEVRMVERESMFWNSVYIWISR